MIKRLLTLSVSISLVCQAGPGSGPGPDEKRLTPLASREVPGASTFYNQPFPPIASHQIDLTADPQETYFHPSDELPAVHQEPSEPDFLDTIVQSVAGFIEWFKSLD